jgi:hypothetical protein
MFLWFSRLLPSSVLLSVRILLSRRKNDEENHHNDVHTKVMKPVFHSSFDVGRSMFDVPLVFPSSAFLRTLRGFVVNIPGVH